MKKLILAAAIVAASCTLAMAQAGGGGGAGGGAGGDVATPGKSAPRVGTEKRDDAPRKGTTTAMGMKKHARHHRKHKKMM